MALVVLALGTSAGTAIFSVVDAVVLRALPFDEHERLAVVLEHDTTRPSILGDGLTTTQMYLDWRREQESFEALAAIGSWSFRLRNEAGEPATARAHRVTSEFLPVLRVAPMLGRNFTGEDEIDGRHRVAILSYGFWRRMFGGDPAAVGRTIELNEESWQIVGVLPRQFEYPIGSTRPTEIFVPLPFRQADKVRGGSRNYNWTAIGRLKPGVSLSQAAERMNRVMKALNEQFPNWSPGRTVRVISLHEHLVGKVRGWMLMLLGAVVLVLLIACANVANLMLARATVRLREMSIRAALGASRWRLVRALVVEGIVLSLCGAALGVLLAYGGVQILTAWLPANLPRVAAIAIDLRVLAAAIAAAVVTGVFFGAVPAFQTSRLDLVNALKDSGRSSTAGAGSQWMRNALVVAEVALAVVLLVGAGLFSGSFARLMSVDLGFDYRNVLVQNVGINFEGKDFAAALKRGAAYSQQMLDAVSRVPGVEAAGAVSGGLPLSGGWSRTGVTIPGRGEMKGDDSIDRRVVSPEYLKVLRVPLRGGRHLSANDHQGGPLVALINETAARKYFPGQDPIGQRMVVNKKELTVVGVVGDIRHFGPEQPPRQECYVPLAQGETLGVTLTIRTSGDPTAALPAVKAAIWSVNKEQRLSSETVTLEAYMDRLIAQRRFNMLLLALFGLLGLVIAAVGIYGVMAYVVAQRTNEIGVRMALGATRGNVVAMVLKRASLLMGIGLVAGGAAAWTLSARVQSSLFEVRSNDARVFVAALATLAAAGLLASALPARRAASVDPLVALRHE